MLKNKGTDNANLLALSITDILNKLVEGEEAKKEVSRLQEVIKEKNKEIFSLQKENEKATRNKQYGEKLDAILKEVEKIPEHVASQISIIQKQAVIIEDETEKEDYVEGEHRKETIKNESFPTLGNNSKDLNRFDPSVNKLFENVELKNCRQKMKG